MIEDRTHTEIGLLIAFSRIAAARLRNLSEYSAALILEAVADDMATSLTAG
jgi:hypothetical protein